MHGHVSSYVTRTIVWVRCAEEGGTRHRVIHWSARGMRVCIAGRLQGEQVAGSLPGRLRDSPVAVVGQCGGGACLLILAGEGNLRRYRQGPGMSSALPLLGRHSGKIEDTVAAADVEIAGAHQLMYHTSIVLMVESRSSQLGLYNAQQKHHQTQHYDSPCLQYARPFWTWCYFQSRRSFIRRGCILRGKLISRRRAALAWHSLRRAW